MVARAVTAVEEFSADQNIFRSICAGWRIFPNILKVAAIVSVDPGEAEEAFERILRSHLFWAGAAVFDQLQPRWGLVQKEIEQDWPERSDDPGPPDPLDLLEPDPAVEPRSIEQSKIRRQVPEVELTEKNS